ncbi:MAG: ABC transporter ATP-binding protein [bacterium]
MIEIQNLKKIFVDVPLIRFWERRVITALDGVNLDVSEGEVVALVGRNGAGKTTLLKTLSSLVLPTSGAARIGGVDVVREPQKAKRLIGLVTGDERSFYWRLTGQANLELFAALHDMRGRISRGRVAETLDLVGLTDRARTSFKSYSTGMRQRLALARALLHDPRVLLLDEPTKGLDPAMKTRFLQLVKDGLAAKENRTVLFATHQLDEAGKVAHRIVLIEAGRIVMTVPANRVEEIEDKFSSMDESAPGED